MQVTGNYSDFYNETMLPALRALTDRGYRKRPAQYPKFMQVNPSTKSIEQFSSISGVGRFQQITEGGKVAYDQPVQGFNKTFKHTRYGLAVPTSIDVVEDDNWQLVRTMHTDLGWSGMETREIQASSVINEAFSTNGPDGVPLCSTSHPLWKIGGVQSNRMTAADLDSYSLQLALTAFEMLKRPSGELIHVPPKTLMVHPNNRFMAYTLLNSKDDPTTSDRATNPLGGSEDGMPDQMVYRYMSSPNAWFLIAAPEETGLVWFDRKKSYTKSWTDDETEVGYIAMRYKKSHGFYNYIGVVGNPGS